MLPTLELIRDLGGSSSKSELEQRLPSAMHLTDEQLAVGFPKSSGHYGKSKIVYRSVWARTYLKRIGALDNSARGVWSITQKGVRYLDMAPTAAEAALRKDVQATGKVVPPPDNGDRKSVV